MQLDLPAATSVHPTGPCAVGPRPFHPAPLSSDRSLPPTAPCPLHLPQASPQVGVMVRELRGEMDRLLGAKIAAPDMELGGSKLVEAVEGLLSTDGF